MTTNWADYKHAYGSATDAPAYLAALLNNDADQAEAIEYLFGTITHQETLHSATLPVLRYCIAQLPELASDARDDVINWICWVGVIANREDSEIIHETDHVLNTFLAYDPLASSSYAWVFHQWRNHATVPGAQVRAQLEKCPTNPLTVAAYGAWGGDTTSHLNSEDLTMRIAALATSYAKSELLPWQEFLPQLQGKYLDEFLNTLAQHHTAKDLREAGVADIQ